MPTRRSDLDSPLSLRIEAEARLREGTAPGARTTASNFSALSVLQGMATAPGGASAALKLLHELQVHQVELDLQQEQLEQSRSELSQSRDDYVDRFDFAPIPYLVVGRDGRIIEGNLAAAGSFGIEQADLGGRPIDSLFAPQCQYGCLAMLLKLCAGSARETFELQVDGRSGAGRRYRLVATATPGGQHFLMILIETA